MMTPLSTISGSLERKLVLLVFTLVLSALLFLGGVIYKHQVSTYRESLEANIYLIGETVAENVIVALRFDVPKDADVILSSLKHIPRLSAARVYRPGGALFAEYQRPGGAEDLDVPLGESRLEFREDSVLWVKTIIHDGDRLGHLVLSHDLDGLKQKRRETLAVVLSVLLVSLFVVELVGIFFLRRVTRPIRHLIDISTLISETGDLTVRAEKTTNDDLGLLVQRYNQMLEQLQQNASDLKDEKEALSQSRDRERSLQDRLSRSERMESLGMLAGGVAHDLNNILGPLVGYPDVILDDMPEGAKHRHEIEQMQMAAAKAAAVIQDLLTLARRGRYSLQPVNLNDIVCDYQRSLTFQQLIEQHPDVRYRFDLDDTGPTLMGSEHHVTQVLLNLTYNAAEATQERGQVVVTTRSTELTRAIEGLEEIPPGRYAVLSVEDQGAGIPEDVKKHIFEPFYTRKNLGSSGSGLGLSVVYGIVKDLEGFIDLTSKESIGSTFTLYFPLTDEVAVPQDETIEIRKGKGSILVVDDLLIQRELAVRILESSGYQVQAVSSGEEAEEVLKTQPVDVVLLDMIMENGPDGLDTFRRLKKRRADIACIIVSGFSESDRVKQAEAEGVKAFLSKPYTRTELLSAIHAALSAPG